MLLGVTHVDGTFLMGSQLWGNALDGSQGSNGHNLTVACGELVAGKDVAEEVSLQIIIILWAEVVIERLAAQLGLGLSTFLESQLGIVPNLWTLPCLAFIIFLSFRLASIEHL